MFRVGVNCSACNRCSPGGGLFSPRRIGRPPQVDYGDANPPSATTIYGAAKLTGRLPGGQTVGVVDAVTGREVATLDRDRKSTRLNSSHSQISYAVFCLKKKTITIQHT